MAPERGREDRDQDEGADHADLVAHDAPADRRPIAARLGRGGGLQGQSVIALIVSPA